MTREQAMQLKEALETLKSNYEHIRMVCMEVNRAQGELTGPAYTFNGYEFEWQRNLVVANFSRYYCGEDDYIQHEFPFEYLWADNVFEIEKQRVEDELRKLKEERQKAKAAEAQRIAEKQEANDRAAYKRLKERYGDLAILEAGK